MIAGPLKKWLAFGSGVGIRIAGPRGAESLQICAVRVRPAGAGVRGGFTIEDFSHQPAGLWGTDYAAFLKKLGLRHVAAAVLLPRHDVIVRPLALPGVSARDLDSAVGFQLDGLHPYNEEDVYCSWSRLPGTSTVLVAVARRDTVERYAALFAEAGVKVGAFTCPAAAVYSALRVFGATPPAQILAAEAGAAADQAESQAADQAESQAVDQESQAVGQAEGEGSVEMYGESPARPIFSASFELPPARAASLAAAEMRIDSPHEPQPLSALLGAQPALPFAAALASACPRLSLPLNLLPLAQRESSSPLRLVPSAALGAVALLLAGALAAFPSFERRRFLSDLNAQIAQITPRAARSAQIDREIQTLRRRTDLLDELRRHTKSDIDVLAELTKIVPPPTWLNLTEISARQVVVGGEAAEAESLLHVLDASPLFEASEFQAPPIRVATGWVFRIKTNREGVH
jgi:type IV pilus assembly PilN-like protein